MYRLHHEGEVSTCFTYQRAAGPRECKSRRDRLTSDVTNLYHGKSIEHLTRFEDRNSVWPKLMVSYKFMLK